MACQCGCGRAVEIVQENEQEGQPYRLCTPCSERLATFSLRPVEWFRLASIHSPWKFALHDDFYSFTGHAWQPDVPVVKERGVMRAPNLSRSATSPRRLFAYAFTRHFLTPETVVAFHRFDPEMILPLLETSLEARTPNPHNTYMACAIAADVLGPVAEDYVRRLLPTVSTETFPGLARAAAGCLPREEALAWAFEYLDGLDAKERFELKDSLAPFADARVLDWIERHADEMGAAVSWQRLAAYSSLSWERARTWLHRGRPLSLVALGALGDLLLVGRLRSPGGESPRPPDFPPLSGVFSELDGYLERDGAPNPREMVEELKGLLSVSSFPSDSSGATV